eukprot:GHVO01021770.1.p2 GENE.GHVO01021770.1~~GHVO01021770.1.p2  ORF type:complete len:208 (-),score=28.43 GHVO01021770.1:909-1532(-)
MTSALTAMDNTMTVKGTGTAMDNTVKGTDKTKSVTDKTKSVTDKTKSVTDKSVTDKTKSVTDKTKSVTDKTKSVQEAHQSVTNQSTGDPNGGNGLSKTLARKIRKATMPKLRPVPPATPKEADSPNEFQTIKLKRQGNWTESAIGDQGTWASGTRGGFQRSRSVPPPYPRNLADLTPGSSPNPAQTECVSLIHCCSSCECLLRVRTR